MPSTPKDHFQYTIQEWSNDPFKEILNKVKDIKVVYDIGANSGGFSFLLDSLFDDLDIYCFEPVGRNFDELKKNMPNAKCLKYGIYYGERESRILWRGENCGAFFVEHVNSGEPRVDIGERVELRELEELKLPKPDLIKIDIEGAEENVIPNSKIIKDTKYLIIEWHPDHVPVLDFFKEHLPKHKIIHNIENRQFLLCLESA